MADKKISALTSLAQNDVVVSTDVLPIVDTSATETKKIAVNALVGAAAAAGLTNVDINSGAIDGTTIGANSAAAGTFTNLTASGTVSFSGATVSNGGSVTTVDINGGTIDGAMIATSDITVGTGKTLNVSSGTLTLANDQISGDKVEGGTINAITINTLTSTAVNATTVDATNVEVTNVKAKDGTAAFTIADSTGKITVSTELAVDNINVSGNAITSTNTNGDIDITPNGTGEVNITKVDIDSGAIDGTTIGGSTAAAGSFTNVTATTITADYIYANNIVNVGSFTWDTNTSSPAAATSVGSRVITPIHAGMRRCVINDSGAVQYYLDPSDSTKKADGTSANIDGTDGQVMVEIPKFYARREVSGTYITWSISPVALPGYTLHPAFTKDGSTVDFRYYSAYDACVYDVSASAYISGLNWDNNSGAGNGVAVDVTASTGDKLASVSGVYPMVGLTRAEFRTIAANRGSGWRQLDFTLWSAVQLLYLIEYQTFYSQNVLGAGNTATSYAASSGTQSDNGGSEAGKSNALGNASTDTTSGASSASRGVAYMSYRGIENFYGNEWNWADGVIVNPDGSVSADQGDWWFTNNSADFSDSVKTNMTQITAAAATGSGVWTTALVSSDNFFVPAASSGGSSSTYITDQYFNSTSEDRVVLVGGAASNGAGAGAFLVHAAVASSIRSRTFGGRLAF